MTRTIRKMPFPGTTDPLPCAYERPHADLARRAAAEGFVLLKNEGHFLPLAAGARLALYGAGASQTVKGGTGSGDVNERYHVSVFEGLTNAGFEITTGDWVRAYDVAYENARQAWKREVLDKYAALGETGHMFFQAYSTTPFVQPTGDPVTGTDADIAIYVIGRNAGEGADRFAAPGDYTLTDGEHAMLANICRLYRDVVVLVNTGGVIDLGFMDEFENIRALMLISQPGMEGGNAVADALLGKVTPSGKLTDTWALRYEDYPGAADYSHNNGNVDQEVYNEDIFVGYRYFDSFTVPVRYGFGYGLSYAQFEMDGYSLSTSSDGAVEVSVRVTNTSKEYSGREVVQVYAMPPEGRLEKEVRRLVAFGKTGLLAPGASETLTLTFDAEALASFDDTAAAWVLEAGDYGIFIGDSLADSRLCGTLRLAADKVLRRVPHICPLKDALKPLTLSAEARRARCAALTQGIDAPVVAYDLSHLAEAENTPLAAIDDEAARLVETLETEQLISLCTGDPVKGQGNALGSAGVSLPGSAGETSSCALEQGVANIVLADGPAGLRLHENYYVLPDGSMWVMPFMVSLEHGLFFDAPEIDGTKYYQYCTAIPVGTLLAQTWDLPLIEAVGAMIGDEMLEFGVTLWLAPGMNIHRNPLCGRNFEYYSEDPLLSGLMAAAMTLGVQSRPGCGTTIKHYCCNNQEDNRMASDSILSERALREIYLRGFGIAIRRSQPLAIMTSYNLINGIHAANNRDTCTTVAREEFGFKGLIMTDWTTTEHGEDCTAAGCIRAGNDLVMPGQFTDHDSIRSALADGSLSMTDLKACAARIVRVILKSDRYH